ncbi:MAG: hypothetical protein HOF94_01055, partial [Alphaproteobacteria bacterium]|nr:hypothetical protein [Alphaproteobacteria bacterium]
MDDVPKSNRPKVDSILPTPEDMIVLPLLSSQQEMLTGHLIDPTGVHHNVAVYFVINGELDLAAFTEASRRTVAAIETLRVTIHQDEDGGYVQHVGDVDDYRIPFIDLSGSQEPSAEAEAFMRKLLSTPFDLAQGPLFRWALIRLSERCHYWVQIYHHIAMDGWSASLIFHFMETLYRPLLSDKNASVEMEGLLSAANSELNTLIEAEDAYRSSARFIEDRNYWLGQLCDHDSAANWAALGTSEELFPSDSAIIDAALISRLRAQADACGKNLSVLFFTVSALVDALHSRQEQSILGLPVRGRPNKAVRDAIGVTANNIPLVIDFQNCVTIGNLIDCIADRLRDVLSHQGYRLADLRADLGRLPTASNFFALNVNVLIFDFGLRFGEANANMQILWTGPVKDLVLTVYDQYGDAELKLNLEGNKDLYSRADLRAYLATFSNLLEQFADNPLDTPISALSLVTTQETEQIAGFQGDVCEIPEDTIPDLLTAQALRTPDGEAVVFEGDSLSYGALAARSNQLARHLVAQGAGP